jgi:tetratricopeptide (TPR) repeat protein
MLHLFKNENFPLKHKIEEWNNLIGNQKAYRAFYSLYDNLIKQLYILYPDNRLVSNAYINHLISSGDITEALRLCKRFLDLKSPKILDFMRIIEIENYLEHPDSVDHYAKLALKAFPKNVDLIQLRSQIAYVNKEYDRAIALTKEALKVEKNDTVRSELWGSIGDIEHARNKPRHYYKAYDKALRLWKDNSSVLNNYAYFLALEKRDLERALEMSTRANELSENNPTYLDTMAWVLYELGRYAEAKKVMQMALSLSRSRSHEYLLHYGDILHALGEEFMAKTYWRKALEAGADKEMIEKRFLPENKTQQQQ